MENTAEEVYIGMTVLVYTEDEDMLFGYVEGLDDEHFVTIKGGFDDWNFYCRAHINNPRLSFMKLNPHTIPQLIDIALDTGNKEDFSLYTQFLKEWKEILDQVDILGYEYKEETVK